MQNDLCIALSIIVMSYYIANGAIRVGRPLFTIFNLSCSGCTDNILTNNSLRSTFSANLIRLKHCRMMNGDSILSKHEYDVKYSNKKLKANNTQYSST